MGRAVALGAAGHDGYGGRAVPRRSFRHGQIPQAIWSAPAKNLLASIPAPNAGAAVFATASAAETLQDDKGGLRADWTHGASDADWLLLRRPVFARQSVSHGHRRGERAGIRRHVERQGAAGEPGAHDDLWRGDAERGASELYAQRECRGPAAAAGWDRRWPRRGFGGANGIDPLKPSTEGIENVAFNDFTMGVDTTALVQAENIYEMSDAFCRIVGKHGLKAGGEFTRTRSTRIPTWSSTAASASTARRPGVDFADFLLGVASSYTQGQAESFYNRNFYVSAFAQDSWKATSQLTVNYGVRWDRIRPVGREVQPTADAGQGRAVAGVSGRAAGAGVSRRCGRAGFTGAAAGIILRRARALRTRPAARQHLEKLSGAAGGKPASGWATGCTTRRTRGFRPES